MESTCRDAATKDNARASPSRKPAAACRSCSCTISPRGFQQPCKPGAERDFSRKRRSITDPARSDIPGSDSSCYEDFRDDAIAILDDLKTKTAHRSAAGAHRGDLSVGAYSSLQVGIKAPKRALS
jgi:hypothetical protein